MWRYSITVVSILGKTHFLYVMNLSRHSMQKRNHCSKWILSTEHMVAPKVLSKDPSGEEMHQQRKMSFALKVVN